MKNAKRIFGVLMVLIALTFVMSISAFAQDTCNHDFVQTSRVEPTSTTEPGKIVFTCSYCNETDEKDIKLFEFNDINSFKTAYSAADDYDILRMSANTTVAQLNTDGATSSTKAIAKPIVIDLNGFTLTTTSGWSGILLGGGASMITVLSFTRVTQAHLRLIT